MPYRKQPFQDFYDHHVDDMDTRWKDFTQVQIDWLINRLTILFPHDKQFSVIDLGCGTGELLNQIAHHFPHAHLKGVDGAPEMVKRANNKLQSKATIIQADLESYHDEECYGVVVSTTVLHHLKSPMDHLKMIHTLLENDGHFFVSEIAINSIRLFMAELWWRITQSSHYHSWSENDFRYFIKTCDFNIINGAILSPDDFWRLQMYHLQSLQV